mgnify:FL=1
MDTIYNGLWGNDYNPKMEVYESGVWMMKKIAKDLGRQYVDEMVEWGEELCSIINSFYDVDVELEIYQSMTDEKGKKWVQDIYSQLDWNGAREISNTFFQEAENRVDEISRERGCVLQDGFGDDDVEFLQRLYSEIEKAAHRWAEKQLLVVGGKRGSVLEDAVEFSSDWENMYDLVEDKVLKRDWLRRANHKLEERASDYFYAAVSDYLYS